MMESQTNYGTALHLESEDPDKDIYVYINSPGGSITSLFDL